MLNEIIANIPADPTTNEIRDAVCEGIGVGAPADLAALVEELLNAGLGEKFYNDVFALALRGVREVNDQYEQDMFGGMSYSEMLEDMDRYAL